MANPFNNANPYNLPPKMPQPAQGQRAPTQQQGQVIRGMINPNRTPQTAPSRQMIPQNQNRVNPNLTPQRPRVRLI